MKKKYNEKQKDFLEKATLISAIFTAVSVIIDRPVAAAICGCITGILYNDSQS